MPRPLICIWLQHKDTWSLASPLRMRLLGLAELVLRRLQRARHLVVLALEALQRCVQLPALHHRLGRHLLRLQLLPLNLRAKWEF